MADSKPRDLTYETVFDGNEIIIIDKSSYLCSIKIIFMSLS